MPIPLLFLGLAAVTGVTGVGKTVKAHADNKTANNINDRANRKVEEANKKINIERKNCGKAFEYLGEKKIYILNGSMQSFINIIDSIDDCFVDGTNESSKLRIDETSYIELKKMGGLASTLAGGAAAGVTSGALTAFGAYGLAQTFAVASTGTAIASLSGAAATNATLAFFGGGALASGAGALGVAGGVGVLGGLVAGPALMVMGFVAGAKADKNLKAAYNNDNEANVICEQLHSGYNKCKEIRKRAYLFYDLLICLDAYLTPLLYNIQKVIDEKGSDFSKYDEKELILLNKTISVADKIKDLLNTSILTEDGLLTVESEIIAEEVMSFLPDKRKKEVKKEEVDSKENDNQDNHTNSAFKILNNGILRFMNFDKSTEKIDDIDSIIEKSEFEIEEKDKCELVDLYLSSQNLNEYKEKLTSVGYDENFIDELITNITEELDDNNIVDIINSFFEVSDFRLSEDEKQEIIDVFCKTDDKYECRYWLLSNDYEEKFIDDLMEYFIALYY